MIESKAFVVEDFRVIGIYCQCFVIIGYSFLGFC